MSDLNKGKLEPKQKYSVPDTQHFYPFSNSEMAEQFCSWTVGK